MAKSEGIKVLGVNRKARFNYSIEESFECGLVLVGTEVGVTALRLTDGSPAWETPAGKPVQPAQPPALAPGAMISVQLVTGDVSIAADGTVTHVDGNRVYAFGHRFLSTGAIEMPFARAEVLTLLPNLSTSFKISAAREWAGSITQDRSVAVAGEIGRQAAMIPVSLSVLRRTRDGAPDRRSNYEMRIVRDRLLSPFLLQLAVFSSVDATEQAIGESTVAVKGRMEFENGSEPLKIENTFAADANLPVMVALASAVPVSYVMQSGFDALRPKRIALDIDAFPRKRTLQIDQVWASRREVRPGDTIEITVLLSGDNGLELARKARYRVPIGAPAGSLQITAADAMTINLTDFRQMLLQMPKSPSQLVSMLNRMRPNTKAYIRLWRTEASYDIQGENLPDPPPSAAMILSRMQPSLTGMPAMPNSKVAEIEIGAGDMVVTGSKTIQVDIKE